MDSLHGGWLSDLHFSKDNRLLVSTGGYVKVWQHFVNNTFCLGLNIYKGRLQYAQQQQCRFTLNTIDTWEGDSRLWRDGNCRVCLCVRHREWARKRERSVLLHFLALGSQSGQPQMDSDWLLAGQWCNPWGRVSGSMRLYISGYSWCCVCVSLSLCVYLCVRVEYTFYCWRQCRKSLLKKEKKNKRATKQQPLNDFQHNSKPNEGHKSTNFSPFLRF